MPALFSPDGKRIVTLDIDRAAMYDNTGKQLGILEKSDRPQGYSFIADRVYFSQIPKNASSGPSEGSRSVFVPLPMHR